MIRRAGAQVTARPDTGPASAPKPDTRSRDAQTISRSDPPYAKHRQNGRPPGGQELAILRRTDSVDRQSFLSLIKDHCRRQGRTLAELAVAIGYHQATLSKWGDISRRIKPSTRDLDAIAALLNLDSFQHK